jgi:uracil-DNA glycosylase family 4
MPARQRPGRLRIHKKPNAEQVDACFPWLEAELRVVQPRVLVLLGATAAQALLGSSFRVSRQRGRFLESTSPPGPGHRHPSSILRAPDEEARALAQGLRGRPVRGRRGASRNRLPGSIAQVGA